MWRQLTETSLRRLPDGRVTPHYDPAMVQQFIHHPDDYLQWDAWDASEHPGAVPARRKLRLAVARGGRVHAHARAARRGGHHSRLWPCAGPERARPVCAGRAIPGGLKQPPVTTRRASDEQQDLVAPKRCAAALALLTAAAVHAAGTVGSTLPADFPVIEDASLKQAHHRLRRCRPRDPHAGDLPARQQRRALPHAPAAPPTARIQALAQHLADNGYSHQRTVGPGLPGRPVRPGGRQRPAALALPTPTRPTCPTCAASCAPCWPTPAPSRSTSSATAWA